MGCGGCSLSGPSKSFSIAFAKPTEPQEREGARADVFTVCVKRDGMEKTNVNVTRVPHWFVLGSPGWSSAWHSLPQPYEPRDLLSSNLVFCGSSAFICTFHTFVK